MNLVIYIPTAGRPQACLEQVTRLNKQRADTIDTEVKVVVSINADSSYDPAELSKHGADHVIFRATDLGGNANYCLALEWLPSSDYLWVVSDDDPIGPEAVKHLVKAIRDSDQPDLIVLSDSTMEPQLLRVTSVTDLEPAPVSSISCSVLRSVAFQGLAPVAFAAIATHFPQIALIQAAISRGTVERVALVNSSAVIDLRPMRDDAISRGRREMGARTGAFVFGGGLLAYLDPNPHERQRRVRRWWRSHWHRLSMYRLAHSREQEIVDVLARSSGSTIGWWILSLPPWWRLKDFSSFRIRGRGIRAQGDSTWDPAHLD